MAGETLVVVATRVAVVNVARVPFVTFATTVRVLLIKPCEHWIELIYSRIPGIVCRGLLWKREIVSVVVFIASSGTIVTI